MRIPVSAETVLMALVPLSHVHVTVVPSAHTCQHTDASADHQHTLNQKYSLQQQQQQNHRREIGSVVHVHAEAVLLVVLPFAFVPFAK
jgi:hypothetical protein